MATYTSEDDTRSDEYIEDVDDDYDFDYDYYTEYDVAAGEEVYQISLSPYEIMYVYNGGVANIITVNHMDEMYVYDGGVANSTTVNNGGEMDVYNGGVANSTTVNNGGEMDVYNGGVANSTIVNNGGYMDVDSGGTANSTIVNNGGKMYVSNGGVANETIVSNGGRIIVSNGGTANSTIVSNGGSMVVSSGGMTTGALTVAEGAVVSAADGSVIEFTPADVSPNNAPLINDLSLIQGNPSYSIKASPSMVKGKYNLANGAYGFNKAITLSEQQLSPDGVVRDGDALYTLAEESGRLEFAVWSSVTAQDFDVSIRKAINIYNTYCCVGAVINFTGGIFGTQTYIMNVYYGGMAYLTTVSSYGGINVSSGGTAHTTTIGNNGNMYVLNGAKAVSTTVGYNGYLEVSGGTVKSTTVRNGGEMVVNGGKVTGILTIEESGAVSVTKGVIDFDISPLSPGNAALVNDLSRITGTPTFTVTAKSGQATGDYLLAEGAADFSSTLTVKCAKEADVTLSVGDRYVAGSTQAYALALDGGQLLLTVRELDTTPPEKPVATADITAPTNKDITVTATFSDDSVKREYSLDGNEWLGYDKGIVMEANGTVWFRAADEAGNVSEASYEVANIDKVAPDAPDFRLTGDSASREVILHASWDKDDAVCRYAVDGAATMQEYVEPLRFSEHARIHFQTEDAVGNQNDLRMELMFGRVTGVWRNGYFARNCIVEDMELEPLEGMNIIGDVFNGSDDSTSLVLTDDDNGDALFLDDLYSASPDISAKARISQVNMIIAGAGDDVIDLTSVRFQCADKGIAVQGGDGNDLIWANNNGTFLFGDAGDDRIVGGGSTDVIAGGSGNDTLHGGGGNLLLLRRLLGRRHRRAAGRPRRTAVLRRREAGGFVAFCRCRRQRRALLRLRLGDTSGSQA